MFKAFTAIALVMLSVVAVANEGVHISDAWARPSAPGAPSAGFMVIDNLGSEDDVLLSVTGDFAKRYEVHESFMEEGVMRMVHLEQGLVIPAGGEVVLKPGSFHLMFMGLPKPFVEGEEYEVTLTFEKEGEVTVVLPVKPMNMGAASEEMANDHSH